MKIELNVKLTPKQVAQAFWDMDSDKQAEMFYELAKIAYSTKALTTMQWHYLGRAMIENRTDTDWCDAREIIIDIASAIGY